VRRNGPYGVNCPTVHQDVNFVGNSSNGFRPNQGINSKWNKPNFPFDNCQQGDIGQNFNRNEPSLRDIVREKVKINEDFGKRIHATDKLLENMSSKMDSFIVAMQNQLNFNKILQTQIQKISTVLPRPNNRDSTNTLVQESVTSISALFQGKVPNSTKKSLREVDREKSSVVGVWYSGYCGMPVMAPNSRYDRFPLVENGWGPMNHVPDKAPPLHVEGEGSPS
jgi:hypothetical protein